MILLALTLAALPALRIEAGPQLPCELQARLPAAALEQRLTLDAAAPHRLAVTAGDDGIQVRLVDGANRELGSRTLRPSARDCAVLPRTIVLLARTWLSAKFPVVEERVPDAGTPAIVAVEPRPSPKPEPRVTVPINEPEPEREPEPKPPPEPEPTPEPEPADAGEAPQQPLEIIDAGTPPPLPPPPPEEKRFALAILGGGAFDLARPTAQATAFLDLTFLRSWGAALELGAESERAVSLPPGTITVQSYWLGLTLRRALVANLHASLGARLFLLPVAARGFSDTSSPLLFAGAFHAAADWRQPLLDDLFLIVRAGVQARIRPEVLYVEGIDGALVLPVWSFFAHAGLGLKL